MNLEELNGTATIRIAGEDVTVRAQDPVKETLKSLLASKGIDSFTILVNGNEVISSSDLPEVFATNTIEVVRSVKSG